MGAEVSAAGGIRGVSREGRNVDAGGRSERKGCGGRIERRQAFEVASTASSRMRLCRITGEVGVDDGLGMQNGDGLVGRPR